MIRRLLILFLAALAIRWGYSCLMYFSLGNAGLLGVDSSDYVNRGRQFVEIFMSHPTPGGHWLGPHPFMMPLFVWLIAGSVAIGGAYASFLHVLLQGIFDAGTCLLIFGIARSIDERLALPAGIAATLNPTQIVMTGQVYPDTPFVFFVALFLLASLHWWRKPSWRTATFIGAGLIAAAWTRALVVPFAIALVLFLLVAAQVSKRLQFSSVAQLTAVLVFFAASLTPIAARNYFYFDSWSLTPQRGQHLARWIVPLIWEIRDGKPWAEGYAEMERRAAELPKPIDENVFQESERYTQVAYEALKTIDPLSIARAWGYGAILNLGTPAIALSPPVMHLPRTGFYATPGASTPEKIWNFLFRSDNTFYAGIILAGIGGLILVRLLQAIGCFFLLKHAHWTPILLLAGWFAFILLVNGPVASPKYRLPLEPILMVLTGAGWVSLWRRRNGER